MGHLWDTLARSTMAFRDLSIELDESLRGSVRVIHDQFSLRVLMCPTAAWQGVIADLDGVASVDEVAALQRLFEHADHPRRFVVHDGRVTIRGAAQAV
jgi:hypothetical protein